MAIIALQAWYLKQYEPLEQVLTKPADLRLSRNSLLKSALRADFLDDRRQVSSSEWFKRYLEGEVVEFYIEGSGGYKIANIDLVSQEIYFTKQELTAVLEPMIFCSWQSQALGEALTTAIHQLNERSRLPLSLEMAQRPAKDPLRISDSQLRSLRKSLLVIADITPINIIRQGEESLLLPHPLVCLEIGYALPIKRPKQILLVQQERQDIAGQFPFDIAGHQQLIFKHDRELLPILSPMLETLLYQFNLFSV